MRILDLALKDLYQIIRDKRSLLFLVAMPVVFTFFMGFAYRNNSEGQNADMRLPLAVVDPEPQADLNRMLTARLEHSESLRPIPMDQEEAMEALNGGEVAGVLVIPDGFSQQALEGATPQLALIAEAVSSEGQSIYQSLRVSVSQLMSAVEVAHLVSNELSDPKEYKPALELAWSKWENNSSRSLVQIEQAVTAETEASDWTGGNPYNQASPGILVQFAIFGLITSAQILVQERKTRTLQRLRTTAMKAWEIVGGHFLAMYVLTIAQIALLIIFGQLVLDVNYLREPLGTLLVSVSLALWVASLGLLIGIFAQEEQQVIMYSMIAMFLFSALGGTWFSLETAGGAFAAIGRLMPSAWAMNGLQNILIRGLDLSSTWLPTGILLAYAAGFFTLAVWRFRKSEL